MNAHTPANAAASAAQPSPASPLAALSGLGTVVYRIGVLALLAAIAWPQISDRLSSLPAASQLAQTGGGFRLGPGRNNQPPASPRTVTPANPPSALLTKLDMPTYGDAYPGGEDMLPRNINGVPVVYVVNLPYLMGGRLDTVKATVQDINPSIIVNVRP